MVNKEFLFDLMFLIRLLFFKPKTACYVPDSFLLSKVTLQQSTIQSVLFICILLFSVYLFTVFPHYKYMARWPSGYDAGLVINRLRVQILASPLSSAILGKLLTHMCLCHQAV